MGSIPKILVVGCGSWGRNIARNLHELGVLHSLCDSNRERLDEVSSKYPGAAVFSSVEEALKKGGFSAAVVATPSVTHYSLGKLFLESGYDVFIEKPLALTVRQGEELLLTAEKNRRIIFVGHILLYHPAVNAIKRLVSSGELGRIQYIYSNRLNLGKVRKEENILWSFAPHDIAIILYLLEESPLSAAAFGGWYLNSSIADVTVTHLDFPSGVKAHIFVSWLHPYKEQRLVVIGDRKMAVFNDTAKDEKLVLYNHSFKWIDRLPVPEQGEKEVITIEEREPLRVECQTFCEALETRAAPLTDGKEGLAVLKILAACEESLQSNGKVVRFTQDSTPSAEARKPEGFFVHPSSFIDENVEIGDGTRVWHFCHVMKNSRIGKNCILGQNVFVGDSVTIGNRVKLENNVSVFKGVTLEDEVFVAPSATFTNVKNPRAFIERKSEYLPTLVKRGATIGANSTIVCGCTIGRYAFVGAGSVVTRDVKDFVLVIGNPARQVGWMCKCGIRLDLPVSSTHEIYAECHACKSGYLLKEESLFEKTG